MTGKSNVKHETWFKLASDSVGMASTRSTKGYLNLVQPRDPKTELRRNFFSQRVVSVWNQLPNSVKIASTTNEFKSAYDSFTGY